MEGVCDLRWFLCAYRHLRWGGNAMRRVRHTGLDDEIFTQNGLLLSVPPTCPCPPTTASAVPSPDSFGLRFVDVSYKFAHPPIPTPSAPRSSASSTTSILSSDSIPCTQFGTLPPCPPSSHEAACHFQVQWFAVQRRRVPHFRFIRSRILWKNPSHCPLPPHPRTRFTKLTTAKANPI